MSVSAPRFHSVMVGYNPFYIDERYTNLKPCGDGSYGFVCSAVDSVTGEKVAIKKVNDVFCDLIDAKRILREIKLLRHFNSHENIITILDIMTSPPNSIDITDIYIVTNLMESDLERIVRSRQKLTDHHYQYFLYQILRALKYIHSANVLHRDLKPSNLLVNANCDLAVCDFGLARGFDCENETMTEYVQTRWYRAPELLCESPHYGRGDNPPHQLEVIVSKLGCPSREKLDFVESPAALQRILRYEGRTPPPFSSLFAPGCNPQAIDLLSRMLQFHPDDRISVTDAMAHPYLKDFYGQMSEPDSDYLFDFDFEKGGSISQNLSKEEVQALMYSEMLVYRPSAGSIEDIPPAVRMRLSFGSGAKQSYESDDGEAMHTARDYDDDDKMVVDDDYDSKMEYDNHSHRYGGYKGYK